PPSPARPVPDPGPARRRHQLVPGGHPAGSHRARLSLRRLQDRTRAAVESHPRSPGAGGVRVGPPQGQAPEERPAAAPSLRRDPVAGTAPPVPDASGAGPRVGEEDFAMKASVFVGTSLDGFIARPDGALDFLDAGGNEPHGYEEFMATV